MNIFDWAKREPVAAGTIITLVGFVCALGYTVWARIPDLNTKIEQYRTDQRDRADKWESVQAGKLDIILTQLAAVRTNLIRLCSGTRRLEKDCDTKELVAEATDIVRLQSRQLSSVRIEQAVGTNPEVAPSAKPVLSQLARFPTASVVSNRQQITAAAVWAAVAKDSNWYVEDGTLRVTYSNGSAAFTPAPGTNEATLNRTASNLNVLSRTLWQRDLVMQRDDLPPSASSVPAPND